MTNRMGWWRDAKFGLFIHWGLYALLAGEYQGNRTDNIAEWIMHDLKIPVKEYEMLASRFNPADFDAMESSSRAGRWHEYVFHCEAPRGLCDVPFEGRPL
jgi:alpha-L-fucosidase